VRTYETEPLSDLTPAFNLTIAVGDGGVVVRSVDGGRSFQRMSGCGTSNLRTLHFRTMASPPDFAGAYPCGQLGDANVSLSDAYVSLGDGKVSLGDVKSSLGDADVSLGDASAYREG
jgi:hypothetical protein